MRGEEDQQLVQHPGFHRLRDHQVHPGLDEGPHLVVHGVAGDADDDLTVAQRSNTTRRLDSRLHRTTPHHTNERQQSERDEERGGQRRRAKGGGRTSSGMVLSMKIKSKHDCSGLSDDDVRLATTVLTACTPSLANEMFWMPFRDSNMANSLRFERTST